MSDSQSSQEVQIKAEQKIEAKVRDLLDKGKTITPFYDDDTLLQIYKECYSSDQIFLNKLQIIAKSRRETQNTKENEWIQLSKHTKEGSNRQKRAARQSERPKYNFLEDTILIERAKKFDPERQRQHRERKKQYEKERQNKNNDGTLKKVTKPQFKVKEEVDEQRSQKHDEKKLKYKVKQQAKSEAVTPKQTESHQKVEKEAAKPVEKRQKYAEKKPTEPVIKKEIAAEPPAKKEAQKVAQPSQPEQITPPPEKKKPNKIQYRAKQQEKPQEYAKTQSPQPVVESKPAAKVEAKIQAKKEIQQNGFLPSPVSSSVKKELSAEVKAQFEASCSQNTFVLKFIQPTEKLQKVSYIRYPNGIFKDITTREVLPSRQ